MSGRRSEGDVQQFLRVRGCGDAVVKGGWPYLLRRWRETTKAIEKGYRGDLDEYLNDMDVRQIIHDLRAHEREHGARPDESPEAEIDCDLRPHLVSAAGCLWGEANAKKLGWTAAVNWWYFTHPREPGDTLREDLAKRGLLGSKKTR